MFMGLEIFTILGQQYMSPKLSLDRNRNFALQFSLYIHKQAYRNIYLCLNLPYYFCFSFCHFQTSLSAGMNVSSSRNQTNDFSSLKFVDIVILALPKRARLIQKLIFLPILGEEIESSVDVYVLELFPTRHPNWDELPLI